MKELGREFKEGRSDCLASFKRSEASNLHAEVFLEELQYVLNDYHCFLMPFYTCQLMYLSYHQLCHIE